MSILGYPNLENKPSELPQILVAGSSGIVTGWLSTKPGDIAGANFPGGKMIFIRFISMVWYSNIVWRYMKSWRHPSVTVACNCQVWTSTAMAMPGPLCSDCRMSLLMFQFCRSFSGFGARVNMRTLTELQWRFMTLPRWAAWNSRKSYLVKSDTAICKRRIWHILTRNARCLATRR